MIKHIKNINVHYEDNGLKKVDTIVLLHGWGQNIEMMMPLGNPFKDKKRVIILDLPGFGASEEPKEVWSVYDYAEFLNIFLKELDVDNPILLGHSFGGKISLAYASKYNVKKLVVFGSPFRKEIEKLSFKTKMLKTVKKIPGFSNLANIAKKYIGSTDYKNASPKMREILVSTVNLDITDDVKKIKCPTLIIWGTNDMAVPITDAYELEKLIPDAGVVEYPGSHYTYLEYLDPITNVLKKFLKEE